ncbi:MAG: cytochrome b [Gammaproteobacteria bacterium]|nr:MAG: cytochrome b [Gammaproteobacteria bacterium]
MSIQNTSERYGSLSIAMHWLMLLLIVAVYACIELREFFPKGSDPRNALKAWHFTLGLSVFFLVWLRLLFKLTQVRPRIEPTPENWQMLLAKVVHWALYVLMFAMPILGWLILSGEGKAIPFYGATLPALMNENKEVAEVLEEIHEIGGTLGYFLIAIHTVAALVHHYVFKDNTLLRMLPGKR